jgi:battenin
VIPSFSVTAFYQINQEGQSRLRSMPLDITSQQLEQMAQEREFQIGSIGLADSMGILAASLVAVPMELTLCKMQIARGREFCRSV